MIRSGSGGEVRAPENKITTVRLILNLVPIMVSIIIANMQNVEVLPILQGVSKMYPICNAQF